MRIGKHEHMKQLDETKRELDFDTSGPTLRMMFTGERPKHTKKKNKKELFFERGGWGAVCTRSDGHLPDGMRSGRL